MGEIINSSSLTVLETGTIRGLVSGLQVGGGLLAVCSVGGDTLPSLSLLFNKGTNPICEDDLVITRIFERKSGPSLNLPNPVLVPLLISVWFGFYHEDGAERPISNQTPLLILSFVCCLCTARRAFPSLPFIYLLTHLLQNYGLLLQSLGYNLFLSLFILMFRLSQI